MKNLTIIRHMLLYMTFFLSCGTALAAEFAITLDDPRVSDTPVFAAGILDQKIRSQLKAAKLQAALFVCGQRIDSDAGNTLLSQWDADGHLIANHSYSHLYYHSKKITSKRYIDDIRQGHEIIKGYKNFTPLYRYPYLKEGNTAQKRDLVRQWLSKQGYGYGYVTIDASDWYISNRLDAKRKKGEAVDMAAYKAFYLRHLWDRANYYDQLANKVIKRSPKHTLLLHHNTINALFLTDVIEYFQSKGWQKIHAKEAFTDSVYKAEPQHLPAGESIIWSLAKEKGDKSLRYPAEDGRYLEADMDKLGL